MHDEYHWTIEVYSDVMIIKNFIINHSMWFIMYNQFSFLKLFLIDDTHFASIIVIL